MRVWRIRRIGRRQGDFQAEVDAESRMKIMRYIENLTHGPMQVEICVGAGPSQAERSVMRAITPLEKYRRYAKNLAKIK